jgi:hypothetical protein
MIKDPRRGDNSWQVDYPTARLCEITIADSVKVASQRPGGSHHSGQEVVIERMVEKVTISIVYPVLTHMNYSEWTCDRTTSEMRGLTSKIISEYSRRSENAQTHI